MPILFDCPRCNSSIQVPDTAAGKKGSCPKCSAKLLVPDIAPPPRLIEFDCPRCRACIRVPEQAIGQKGRCPQCQAKVLVPAPGQAAPEPAAGPGPEPTGGDAFPDLNPGMYALPMESGSVAPSRVRSRRRGGRWIIPVVLMAVFLGYAGWLYLAPDASFVGEMTIERLSAFPFPDVPVEEVATGLSHTKYRQLARDLEGDPLGLNTSLSRLSLSSRKERVYLTLSDGVEAGIYRVDPRKRPGLLKWIADNTAELNAPREAAIDRDMPKFIAGVKAARDEGAAEAIIGYRDTALYGYLTSAFGFHVVAVVKGQAYRCVFEDNDGRLYFLLPGETRSFELRGRPVGDSQPIFPGKITCAVARAKTRRAVTDPAETAPKTDEEPASSESEMPANESTDEPESSGEMVGDNAMPLAEEETSEAKTMDPAMAEDADDSEMSPGMKPAMKKPAGKKAAPKSGMMKDAMMDDAMMDDGMMDDGMMKDGMTKDEMPVTDEAMPAPAKPKKKTAAN